MATKRVYTYVEILWVCVRKELNTLLTMSLENGKNGNDFSDVYLNYYFVTFKYNMSTFQLFLCYIHLVHEPTVVKHVMKECCPYPNTSLQKFFKTNFYCNLLQWAKKKTLLQQTFQGSIS